MAYILGGMNMVVLHRGTDAQYKTHVGYVVRRQGAYYIIDLQGAEHRVRGTTVVPILDEMPEEKLEDYPEAFNRVIIAGLHNQGIYTVRDLLQLTPEEIRKLFGVGAYRYKKIMEILEKYKMEHDPNIDDDMENDDLE